MACSTPAPIQGAQLFAPDGNYAVTGPGSTPFLFYMQGVESPPTQGMPCPPATPGMKGGPCQSTAITYFIGTGASDLTLWTVPLTLSPRCDEIQDICVPVANAGKAFAGALTGNYDVSGETKHYLNVRCQDANAIRDTVTPVTTLPDGPIPWT